MKIIYLVLIVVIMSIVLAACTTTPVPVQDTLTVQAFRTPANDFANDVAVPRGGVGAAIVVGSTDGSLDGTHLGLSDGFIRKYGSIMEWGRQFGTSASDLATDVTVSSTGVSYVFGTTLGALQPNKANLGGRDVYLRKYNASGTALWTRQFGTTGDDNPLDVTADSQGFIYVLSDDANTLFTIRKYNTNGKLVQIVRNNTPSIFGPTAIAVDSQGIIFVLAQKFFFTDSSTKFAPILVKYSSSGTLLSADALANYPASSQFLLLYDLVINSSDQLYFSLFDFQANLGGVIGKVDSNGNSLFTIPSPFPFGGNVPVFGRAIGPMPLGNGTSTPFALTLDAAGYPYLTGSTNASFGGFVNAGADDIFVQKYTQDGFLIWTKQFGGNGTDRGSGIAVSDKVYVTGSSSSNPNLLGQTVQNNPNASDAFLARLNLEDGSIISIDQ
jgi:hypothetical protein